MSDNCNRKVAFDCKYYIGDRPCTWHKNNKVLCECENYVPLQGSLLIIKLDAMGDVLRTTCLLPCIARKWPGKRIVWITRRESTPLLENNPYINEVIAYGPDALLCLTARAFEIVINLDAGKISSSMASMARGSHKIGYLMHDDGYVSGTNESAMVWLRMGIFDDLKKNNQRTYQEIMCSILDIPVDGMKYVLELKDVEKEKGREHLAQLQLDFNKCIIGIHTGGGDRWALKQWHEKKFIDLIRELSDDQGRKVQVLLFGGPSERERNQRIKNKLNVPIFDAGCDNHVRHFAALIRHCDVVVTGDSLAMHIALAMTRRGVVLFGPTSNKEIELFGNGEKIVPDMKCLVCYKSDCDFAPNCMDLISIDAVKQAIIRQLTLQEHQ